MCTCFCLCALVRLFLFVCASACVCMRHNPGKAQLCVCEYWQMPLLEEEVISLSLNMKADSMLLSTALVHVYTPDRLV